MMKDKGGVNTDSIKKWFGTDQYRVAQKIVALLSVEMPNPTHRQVEKVLNCVRDLVGDMRIRLTE